MPSSSLTYDFDGDFDDAYEYVKGEILPTSFRGSRPDQSRETEGAWRGTTRDAHGNLNGQAEFFPGDEDDSYEAVSPPTEEDRSPIRTPFPARTAEYVTDESAPDISRLVPLASGCFAGIAAGVVGVKVAQHIKRQTARRAVRAANPCPGERHSEGWYSVSVRSDRLRYWDGVSWAPVNLPRDRLNAPRLRPIGTQTP